MAQYDAGYGTVSGMIASNIETVQNAAQQMAEAAIAHQAGQSNFTSAVTAAAGHLFPLGTSVTLDAGNMSAKHSLRLVAGQVSTVTITGLAGWHVLTAALSLQSPSSRLAIQMPDGPLDPNTAFPVGALAYQRSHRFDTPRRVHKIIWESAGQSILPYDADGLIWSYVSGVHGSYAFSMNLGKDLTELVTLLETNPAAPPRVAFTVDNAPKGIAISDAQDRMLHRVPQALALGDLAQTPDIAAALNARGGGGGGGGGGAGDTDTDADSVTLNILPQSDGVVLVSGALTRRRQASGFAAPPAEQTRLSPWQVLELEPQAPGGADTGALSCDLSLTARPDGAMALGLLQQAGGAGTGSGTGAGASQRIRPGPRLHICQPFQPLAAQCSAPLRALGVWLFTDRLAGADSNLRFAVHEWDAATPQPGAELVAGTGALPARAMDMVPGPDGLWAAWLPFDTAWEVDMPQQDRVFALVLSDWDGPGHLLESTATHARLSPCLSRQIDREATWHRRSYGGADKALLFDLGLEITAETPAALTITSDGGGGAAASLALPPREADLSVSLPYGRLSISGAAQVTLSDLRVASFGAPD